jgi:Flp pilus assembly pilin Flp
MRWLKRLLRDRKGAVLAEYSVLLAGILVVALAAISMGGHKINDLFGTFTVLIPGAHPDDNGPINSGQLIETQNDNTSISLAVDKIQSQVNADRFQNTMGFSAAGLMHPVGSP